MHFLSSQGDLFRIFIHSIVGYLSLVVLLRITGNRTLSQMNSFDFIVTVAMGSTFSSTLLQKDIALFDGLLALFILVMLQFLITKLSVKFAIISNLVKTEPTLLFHNDQFLDRAMNKARVGKEEILSAMRQQGMSTISQVEAAVLESNGKISVIAKINQERMLANNIKTFKNLN